MPQQDDVPQQDDAPQPDDAPQQDDAPQPDPPSRAGEAGPTGPAGLVRLAWRDADAPSLATVARRLREEGVAPHAWSNGPGDRYGTHDHGYTKVLVCAAGSITFLVGPDATPVELWAGDGFVLPAGTSHAAVVGPEGCTCLEGRR